MAVAAQPRVLSSTSGRVRVGVPAWSRTDAAGLERKLEEVPGIRTARASSRTGNVLVEFDPARHDAETICLHVQRSALGDRGQAASARDHARQPGRRPPSHTNRLLVTRASARRARVAVHGLDRDPELGRRLVDRLGRRADVHRVTPSPLTGRVLLELAEGVEDLTEILDEIADIEPPPAAEDSELPAHPLDPAPIIEGTGKLVGAALGLALLLVRRSVGATAAPIASTGPGEVASTVGLVESIPPVAGRIEQTLGHDRKELLFATVGLVAMTSSGSTLGLAFAGASAMRLLTEALARRAGWRAYEARVGDEPPAHPGAVVTLAPGKRAPLPGEVLEGHGVAADRDGAAALLSPGMEIGGGARVHGGSVTVRLRADGAFPPRPRAPRPRRTLAERYLHWLPYPALAYAGATLAWTRSLPRTATALLLVNPRPAFAGIESADRGAATRVMRAGVTVVGTRRDRPVERPDVLVVDTPRTLCDGWELRTVVSADPDLEANEVARVAGAVAAAADSPWGAALPVGGRVIAEEGTFDGSDARASVEGEQWLVGPPAVGEHHGVRRQPGDELLVLRRDGGQAVGTLALQPHLSRGTQVLVAKCRERDVRLELVTPASTSALRRLARRAGVPLVVARSEERVRALRDEGLVVACVSDSVAAAAAFDAADLSIGLSSGFSGRFMARADLLAPRLEAVAAIVEAGHRRDVAVRDGALIAVAANIGGALWGWVAAPSFARGTRAVHLGGLGAIAVSAWRLRGGRRARSVAERLADPFPERWGRETVHDVFRRLGSGPRGLSAEEVRRRSSPTPSAEERRRFTDAVVDQITSPLVAVLGAGAALSLAIGALGDVVMIAAVVAANAAVGAWQEGQAGAATRALARRMAGTARVVRDGHELAVPASELVVGDVLVLRGADRIPADARLIADDGLEIDEAALTGESIPVLKTADGGSAADRVVLDGTDVVAGSGRAVAVAVGAETRMGAIAAALRDNGDRRSPLDERLGRILFRGLPLIALGGGLVTIAGVLWGRPPLSQFALGASVAIAAVPEGLPLLAGVAESAVASRLADRKALVTRLSSVEALGRVDVACADKTGTLTTGRLAVTVVADTGTGSAPPADATGPLADVLMTAALASPAPTTTREQLHPTDAAVVDAARAAGLHERPPQRDGESAFAPSQLFHATRAGGRLHVKGAAEALAERCTHVRRAGGEEPLDPPGRARLLDRAETLAADGLRVLLVAVGDGDERPDDPRELTALGFLGISDPLRPTAPQAVGRCRRAGVRVVLITGDHAATALSIARQAGLPSDPGQVLTGPELAALDDDELRARLETTTVIARSGPMDKLRIVEALQTGGHVVAMTGDGVNDAPALRLADVGVAMGRGGTDVARQAADVVLTDDDFATLTEALVEGRGFWHNMRRALGLLLGGNAGEVLLMTAAGVAGMPAPLTTRQVLSVNLLTDVLPAVSVAVQAPEHRNLADLAREGGGALDAPLRTDIVRRALATGVPSIAAFVAAARTMRPIDARSVAYVSIVTTQLAQTVDMGRAEGRLTPSVIGAVLGSLGIVAATVAMPPLRAFLGLGSPPLLAVAGLGGAASVAAVALGRALPLGRLGVDVPAAAPSRDALPGTASPVR